MAHNVSAKPDARREARVPQAKARSAAAGFACYVLWRAGRRRFTYESANSLAAVADA